MRFHLLTLLAALSPCAFADVKFTVPAAGAQIPAGTLSVQWTDSGVAPAISDLTAYTLQLMVGGNDDSTMLALTTITATGQFSAGNAAQAVVSAGLAASSANGFFLKMISTATEGGTVINYSDRFTLTGMTGVTPPNYVSAIPGGTAGPATVNQVANNAGAAAPAAGAGTGDGVPYNLQTGLTKYAPMQPIPPTKITQKKVTPLFPTSAYTVAKTWLPQASIQTTITASQTFSVQSRENTVSFTPRICRMRMQREHFRYTDCKCRPHRLHNRQTTWRSIWLGGRTRRCLSSSGDHTFFMWRCSDRGPQ